MAPKKRDLEPPFQTKLLWCPVCGRNDRFTPFTGKSHFSYDGRCPGKPEEVIYVRAGGVST